MRRMESFEQKTNLLHQPPSAPPRSRVYYSGVAGTRLLDLLWIVDIVSRHGVPMLTLQQIGDNNSIAIFHEMSTILPFFQDHPSNETLLLNMLSLKPEIQICCKFLLSYPYYPMDGFIIFDRLLESKIQYKPKPQ